MSRGNNLFLFLNPHELSGDRTSSNLPCSFNPLSYSHLYLSRSLMIVTLSWSEEKIWTYGPHQLNTFFQEQGGDVFSVCGISLITTVGVPPSPGQGTEWVYIYFVIQIMMTAFCQCPPSLWCSTERPRPSGTCSVQELSLHRYISFRRRYENIWSDCRRAIFSAAVVAINSKHQLFYTLSSEQWFFSRTKADEL